MRAWRRISLSKPVPDSGARRRAARCAAPIGLLPSFALPGLSPTRPSAQGRRKEPTERPLAAHSASMRAPLLPGGAQKARSHRTRARLASPPPGFLEALTNRSLQQNERKARSRRRAPQVRFASPHRSAYRGCTQRPADPAAPQRGPDAPPPPSAPRSLPSALTAWSGPSCRRAAAPQGGSAAPARPPEPPGAVGPGRERSCCAHAAARRSYSDPPIKGGQSAGGGHVTGQFQLPRRIFWISGVTQRTLIEGEGKKGSERERERPAGACWWFKAGNSLASHRHGRIQDQPASK